jgi:hypothetical protein
VLDVLAIVIWPLVVLILATVYRHQLRTLVGKRLRRLRAGPFEAEWDQEAEAVRDALAGKGPGGLQAMVDSGYLLHSAVQGISEVVYPGEGEEALDTAKTALKRLRERTGRSPFDEPGGRIGVVMAMHLLIEYTITRSDEAPNREVLEAFASLTNLRNIVVHSDRDPTMGELTEFMFLGKLILENLPRGPEAKGEPTR